MFKKFIKNLISICEAVGTARAATALTRIGRWREAQSLMNK